MKVLMISTDRKIFEPTSAVRARMLSYAADTEELFIVVLGLNKGLEVEGRLKYLGLSRGRALGWRPAGAFDLVTAQDPFETGLIGWLIARRLRAKLELQIHTDFLNPYFAQSSFLNYLRVWIARFLLPRATRVRVVSQRIKKSLEEAGLRLKAPVEVRPIAVEIDKIKNAPRVVDLHQKYPQFKKIILMASRLEPEKNIKLALAALKLVDPSIGLVIVGSGCEKINPTKNVIVEDWVDQATLYSYYKTADLFLLTSFYEGYGMTLVEAAAAGCPIISTDVGIAREIGATITPYDPASLARLITSTL
jgi:glycosyltransferase involved in cell wall biosynthesis